MERDCEQCSVDGGWVLLTDTFPLQCLWYHSVLPDFSSHNPFNHFYFRALTDILTHLCRLLFGFASILQILCYLLYSLAYFNLVPSIMQECMYLISFQYRNGPVCCVIYVVELLLDLFEFCHGAAYFHDVLWKTSNIPSATCTENCSGFVWNFSDQDVLNFLHLITTKEQRLKTPVSTMHHLVS